jgi:hypothetical protein
MLGLALVLVLALPVSAQTPSEAFQTSKSFDGLFKTGWVIVNQGVLQKRHPDGRVETWGFGPEGRQWHVLQLERELGRMLVDYEVAPSADLAAAIDIHRELLGHSRDELTRELTTPELGAPRTQGKAGCTVSYSWHATASQNASATATAAWSHSCGDQASTYAYAYGRKVNNGVTTQHSQTDPSGPGSNISSSASASVSGGAQTCYSYARAYVDPPDSAFYEIIHENFTCSIPDPPVVTISGASIVNLASFSCQTVTWTSSVTGGSGTRSYQWKWNGSNVGTGSSYTRSVCPGDIGFNTLRVDMTDSAGSAFDTHDVYVDYEDPGCYQNGQQVICQ